MERLPQPVLTSHARRCLEWEHSDIDRIHRALLSTVDGRRNVIQLESVAKAMGLPEQTLDQLREQGWVDWEAGTASTN